MKTTPESEHGGIDHQTYGIRERRIPTPETAKHTPTPWRIADSSEIHAENGQPICAIAHEENSNLTAAEANANAAHIVLCVNSHDRLVKALHDLDMAHNHETLCRAKEQARATLAAAQPKP